MRIKKSHTQKPLTSQFSTFLKNPNFKHHLRTTTTAAVYLLRPPPSLSSTTAAPPWITAGDGGGDDDSVFLHPLTFHHHHSNRPRNFSLSKFRIKTLAVFHRTAGTSFDKLLVIPKPKPKPIDDEKSSGSDRVDGLLVLYGGGRLLGRVLGKSTAWVDFSAGVNAGKFDDLTVFNGKIYAVDRYRQVCMIYNKTKSRTLKLGKTLITRPGNGPGGFGWRNRFVVNRSELYLVVRELENSFRVYRLIRRGKSVKWGEIRVFEGGKVLFMGRDCYFFTKAKGGFPGREYRNCIVFSEAAFPVYGKNCWEFTTSVRQLGSVRTCEDDVAVYRLSDGAFAREGEDSEFPRINWAPPPWVFQVCLGPDVEDQSRLMSCSSQSESESDEDEGLNSNSRDENGEAQSDLKDSNSKDEQYEEMQSDLIGHYLEQERMDSDPKSRDLAGGKMQCDVNSQENVDKEMHSDENIEGSASLEEDVSPSVSGRESVSTDDDDDDDEVTGTLLSMNGRTPRESSRKNVKQSIPRACTSTTTESRESDSVITKFEGLDIRSDSVPTLQKIWRKHGNIIENSSMHSGYIVARALEALATMVRILEENSAQSLSDCQADYLSSTLSDLRCIFFNVSWLIPFVERAVKLHKSKPLVDSLNNLSQLSSQVKERKAIVLDEVAKLNEEQNKLTKVMAKVFKFIPFSGEVKLDEPVGTGLT